MARPALAREDVAAEIPDYVGHYLDVAFSHAVRRHLGIPKLVDSGGRRVRVAVLADWKVVRQYDGEHCLVFEVEMACP